MNTVMRENDSVMMEQWRKTEQMLVAILHEWRLQYPPGNAEKQQSN